MLLRISCLVILIIVLVLAGCTSPGDAVQSDPPTTTGTVPAASAPDEVTTPTTITENADPVTPTPSESTPTPTPEPDELVLLTTAERDPHDRVALVRALAGQPDAPLVASTEPIATELGDMKTFWVHDFVANSNYEVAAELRYAGPILLVYVEQGTTVDQAALETSARTFENEIYPRTRNLFGSEWQPGVDGDPRIVVLNVSDLAGGVIGYFSSRDSVPRSVNQFSNEHEMFYMDISAVPPGSEAYLNTLAHEFQHMIHWNEQRRSNTWFNEGFSTLSEDLNGYTGPNFTTTYLTDPDVQLTGWNAQPGGSLGHYGAVQLFMRYMYVQYTGETRLRELIQADASRNLQAFADLAAEVRPDITQFADLFADWTIANLVNNPQLADGRYSYDPEQTGITLLPRTIEPQTIDESRKIGTVHQFGADYYTLPPGPITVTFSGTTSVQLVGELPRDTFAWWSGRDDNSTAMLTHNFDLRDLESATLQFDTWHELETGYDYAFVSVSTDGGVTWETLPGRTTSDADPHGANYGNGLTGHSGFAPENNTTEPATWITEEMDLTPYVGQAVQVRFWQINDESYSAPGLLIDNVRIPELAFSDNIETGPGEWESTGFVRVDGELPQMWELQLLRTDATGTVQVEPVPVNEDGQAAIDVPTNEQVVLVVGATTPYTTNQAQYMLEVLQP